MLNEKPPRPFAVYFHHWLNIYVKAHCKESTRDRYQRAFHLSLFPAFRQKDITMITREDVKRLAYSMLAQGKSRNTVKAALTPLELFNHAVEDGLSHRESRDADHETYPRGRRSTRQKSGFLTREELGLLLRTCQAHFPDYYPFVSLLARTGLRPGEALALQWEDFDFQGRFITVHRAFSGARLSTPKNGKTRRVDGPEPTTY
ncbi:MAG: tyrosine-type recombinase/integrase [Candidatus Binatia bacterium]